MLTLLLANIMLSRVLQFCSLARSKIAQKLVNWEIIAQKNFLVSPDPQELEGTWSSTMEVVVIRGAMIVCLDFSKQVLQDPVLTVPGPRCTLFLIANFSARKVSLSAPRMPHLSSAF